MINENLHNFMSAVKMKADEWKEKSFEECITGFLKKTIKQSTTLNIPENTSLDTKTNVINESTATIDAAAKKIVNNAFIDDHSSMHNIDFAKEIVNPKDEYLTNTLSYIASWIDLAINFIKKIA